LLRLDDEFSRQVYRENIGKPKKNHFEIVGLGTVVMILVVIGRSLGFVR